MTKDKSDTKQLTIDGKQLDFTPGQTVLQVALENDIYIPHLCYIEGLKSYGGCRLCVVKIVGDRKPYQTSCSTPAKAGMEIITKDEELQEMRRNVIQMIISEHPNNCLVCEHSEKCNDLETLHAEKPSKRVFGCFSCPSKEYCELREIIEYLEIEDLEYDLEYHNYPQENDDLFFTRDYNLCILCGKCVRACSDLRGVHAIDLMNRGHDTKVSTPMDVLHIDTNCQFCGACVDVCPVGVYSAKKDKFIISREDSVKSTCGFCSVGCGFDYYPNKEGNKLVEGVPDQTSVVNRGQACVIGRFCAPYFNNAAERLDGPRIKENGKFVEVSWDDAYAKAKQIFDKYSSDEIGVLISPDLTNETAYMLKSFSKEVLKTKNFAVYTENNPVDFFDEISSGSRSIRAIESSRNIVFVNANVQKTHAMLMVSVKKAKENGAIITNYITKNANINVPKECRRLSDEERILDTKALIEELSKLKLENATIFFGPSVNQGIVATLLNISRKEEKVQLIPLYSRANLEGVYIQSRGGISQEKLFKEIQEGAIKALYTTEPLEPELLDNLDALVVQDIYPFKGMKKADLILPGTTFLETEGSFTNLEGRNLEINTVVSGSSTPETVKPEWAIIQELAKTMEKGDVKPFSVKSTVEISKLLEDKPSIDLNGLPKVKVENVEEIVPHSLMLKDFKYRGHLIRERVEDLNYLVKQREMDELYNPELIKQEIINEMPEGEVSLLLESNGEVLIGQKRFGLKALKNALDAARIANQSLNVVVDVQNDQFYCVDASTYCLCNNYKDNLYESDALIMLDDVPGRVYARKHNGSEDSFELELTDGLILLSKHFVDGDDKLLELRQEEFFDKDDRVSPGMQSRAIRTGRIAIASADLYNVPENSEDEVETPISQPSQMKWGLWATNPNRAENKGKTKFLVNIDRENCIGCGTCLDVCPHDAITLLSGKSKWVRGSETFQKAYIDSSKCVKCAKCVVSCPTHVISLKPWHPSS